LTRPRLPGPAAGRRIGLFGGSFNPAHGGHRHVAETAQRRLRLDAVWWIVARGNPLKSRTGSFAARLASAAEIADASGMHVCDIEHQLGLTYTIDTLRSLQAAAPDTQFVWIMGADNLRSFHRWQRWREIAALTPIAVIDRPRSTLTAAHSRAASFMAPWRLDEADGRLLANRGAPGFVFLHGPRSESSSTALRARGQGLAPSDTSA